MKLDKLEWVAHHKGFIVKSSENEAYTKIRRDSLVKLVFKTKKIIGSGREIFVLRNLDLNSKWDIMWRLRSQVEIGVMGDNQTVSERFWIIEENIDKKRIYVIRESGEIEQFESYEECKRKPLNKTKVDMT